MSPIPGAGSSLAGLFASLPFKQLTLNVITAVSLIGPFSQQLGYQVRYDRPGTA